MSTSNWKPGDVLLCVDAKGMGSNTGMSVGLIRGNKYVLQELHRCTGSSVDVGTRIPGFLTYYCPYCDAEFPTAHYYTWRFIKWDPWLLEKDLDLQLQEDIEKSRRVINPPDILIHQGNTK